MLQAKNESFLTCRACHEKIEMDMLFKLCDEEEWKVEFESDVKFLAQLRADTRSPDEGIVIDVQATKNAVPANNVT